MGFDRTKFEKRDRSSEIEGGSGEGRCREMIRRRVLSSKNWAGMVGEAWKKPFVALEGSILSRV